jgi:hypothetical protein
MVMVEKAKKVEGNFKLALLQKTVLFDIFEEQVSRDV